ncbi:MAG: hypothetical protein QNJ44_04005 [Rhodobacter sp.]|nr:hypothetical protein [Rhodobacter sp.]
MIRALLFLAVAVGPTVSWAKPVPVQSGEHADFSRLVLIMDEVPPWRFGRVEGGYEMRPDGADEGYDLSRVFDFIPRDRITSVEIRPGGHLFLRVDCDCHGDAFEIRNGLVIDIKDGPAGGKARFETRLPEPVADPADAELGADIWSAQYGSPSHPFSIRSEPARTQYAWRDQIALEFPGAGSAAALDPGAVAEDGTGDAQSPGRVIAGRSVTVEAASPDGAAQQVADAQASLLAQISRAAAQGLIEADLAAGPNPGTGGARTGNPGPATDSATMHEDPGPAETVDNVAVRTAVDQGRSTLPDTAKRTPDGGECIPSAQLDVASWGEPLTPGAGLGAVRSAIVGEFDMAEPENIERLARAYLYLTFGAEARALLLAYPGAFPRPDIYAAIADIMDDGFAGTPGVLSDQLGCETRAALWALLARPSLGRSDAIASDAILVAFGELPLHLRRHLGPGIAQRYLGIGDTDTAQAIRNSVTRAPGDHGAALGLVEADLSLAQGDDGAADDRFLEITGQGGPLAPQALIRLIDTRAETGREISDDFRRAAEALAFEHRGTELGADLARAALRALIASGRIMPALNGIAAAQDDGVLADDQVAALRQELFQKAAESATDEVFLRAAVAGPLGLGARPRDVRTRRNVAARLLDLGLPEPARTVLSETRGVPEPEDRLQIAEAFLMEDRPDLAIGYLAGLSDPRALRLRARSHEAMADYDGAAVVFARLGALSEETSALWRAKSWADAHRFDPVARQAAANLTAVAVRVEDAGPGVSAGPLERNRDLIGQSRDTRAILGDLLDATPRP